MPGAAAGGGGVCGHRRGGHGGKRPRLSVALPAVRHVSTGLDPAAAAAPRLLEAFPLAADCAELLLARRLTVAVAESCTGGLLGAVLTAVPGSSAYMLGGVIAYSDEVKRGLLGVDAGLLRTAGAVSETVAEAMATGVRQRLGTDIGLAITGVAGPDGGTRGKPVGLVFVAAVTASGGRTVRLDGDLGREANRARAVAEALALCIEAAEGRR
ncbi:MAG: nicotinamide-nucleotide amidohydrolase family protein [Candidatus Dormibacteraeota bacterium]|nr:nicotinamide-nucleotide amidohydrolase family protein [Candidatus Dormibacteraeota bacterium]